MSLLVANGAPPKLHSPRKPLQEGAKNMPGTSRTLTFDHLLPESARAVDLALEGLTGRSGGVLIVRLPAPHHGAIEAAFCTDRWADVRAACA